VKLTIRFVKHIVFGSEIT